MTEIKALERLLAVLATEAIVRTTVAIGGRTLALGWATVELDRAAVDLGAALRLPSDRFADVEASLLLGARCRVARGALADGISLVLLEPVTEGRLAAKLARFGEGPAAVWLAVADVSDAVAVLGASGAHTSTGRAGPFGAERLIVDGPIHGPHRLLVERAGTIDA